MKDLVSISDFAKLDLRVGKVIEASDVKGSQKLLKLQVDFGQELRIKTIYSGIKAWYAPQTLMGRSFIFVVNLQPKTFKVDNIEHESWGMLVAAGDVSATLYHFDKELAPGESVH